VRKLDFVLPDVTRFMWASEDARAVWEPRIQAINAAWLMCERRSGHALQGISPNDLPGIYEEVGPLGLSVVVLGQQGVGNTYTNVPVPLAKGQPWAYRVAICTPDKVNQWLDAWHASDYDWIGRLLGYPDCCIKFFQKVWVEEKGNDTTWQMAQNAASILGMYRDEPNRLDIEPCNPQNNILMRWMGPRMVSHLPCSFNCAPSIEIGNRNWARLNEFNVSESMWLRQILDWPMEWSALHGIAEIRTPILKIMTRTDATAEKLTVRWMGRSYPPEGARGLSFPYRGQAPRIVDMWTENGFTSLGAMIDAHQTLAKIVPSGIETALDLGCGNGELLKRINVPSAYGIDSRAQAIRAARQHFPGGHFQEANVKDGVCIDGFPENYDLVLLSAARLEELGGEDGTWLMRNIRYHTRYLLVYSYNDVPVWDAVNHPMQWSLVATNKSRGTCCSLLEKK
jgi:hypothetical protein